MGAACSPARRRVQQLFHSVQLNVNNPHFLIMQGRITKARAAAAAGRGRVGCVSMSDASVLCC